MKKQHIWSSDDDKRLKVSVGDCEPIFEHFGQQNKSYTKLNAWDAVAGRMLPDVCVTGAACMRRWEILKSKGDNMWDKTIEMVERYERELAETTFDNVSVVVCKVDSLHAKLDSLADRLAVLEKLWK